MRLPGSLIQSVAQERIVPFVGSGVSMAVKRDLFPSWPQLLRLLADKLDEEAKPKPAQIVRLFVDMEDLNQAADNAIRSLGKAHFREAMKSIFGMAQPHDVDLSLPKAIWSLKPRMVVTTNYDRVLEWAKPSQAVRNTEVSNLADLFSSATPEQPTVWHVHGHISDTDTVILSPQQYNALYRDAADDKHPLAAARQQIRNLISNRPLLFIGFGLQDEYVMDALETVLEMFKGNLQPSYALLKKGDSRAAELWKKYSIDVVEFDDYGQPLVDRVTQIRVEATAWNDKPGDTDPGPRPIPASYVKWLTDQCADITPFGMSPREGQSVCLQQVYVPPVIMRRLIVIDLGDGTLESRVGRPTRRIQSPSTGDINIPAGNVLLNLHMDLLLHRLGEQSLYVAGDPGTGKSTFCRWVSWLAATGEIPRFSVAAPDEFQEVLPDSLRLRLPVLVRLREFAEHLPAQAGRRTLNAVQFQSALEGWLNQTRPGGLTWSDVAPRLKAGSLLLILDGVDELALSSGDGTEAWSPQECLLTGLTAVAADWMTAGNRLLVTSRPYGLEADQVRALDRAGLPEARMEAMPEAVQDLLAARWFVALPKTSADGKEFALSMLREVRQLSQGVEALAGNPLLLTAICIIYGEGKQLPKDIHDLYHRIVNTSLHSRYQRDARVIELVRARLAAVAFGMHTGEPFEPDRSIPAPEVTIDELDRILAGYIGANRETESGFRSQIDAREDLLSHSGLLSQGGSDRAAFFHLSFQEFLAAEQLSRLNEGADKLLQIFLQHAEVPNWRPTLRFLLARRVAIQGLPPTLELLDKMLRSINPTRVSDRVGLALSVVDGLEILRELGPEFQLQNPCRDQFTTVCLKAIEQAVDLKARAELTGMLGRIGDPRVASNFDQDAAWVTVEPGNYVFGDDNQPFRIDEKFGLSKFPVTNAQFAGFIREGYSDASFWHPTGWQWRCESSINEPSSWNDTNWNGPTQPVVGISWWEADAFCRWAKVRLPTEHEWEAAARGPRGLVYPWGNEWQTGICNSFECGLGKTSPVGIFPGSVAACGAHDMAGNVLEWCKDHFDPAEKEDAAAGRVMRGGFWRIHADFCHSSIRYHFEPDDRYSLIGFRVAKTL